MRILASVICWLVSILVLLIGALAVMMGGKYLWIALACLLVIAVTNPLIRGRLLRPLDNWEKTLAAITGSFALFAVVFWLVAIKQPPPQTVSAAADDTAAAADAAASDAAAAADAAASDAAAAAAPDAEGYAAADAAAASAAPESETVAMSSSYAPASSAGPVALSQPADCSGCNLIDEGLFGADLVGARVYYDRMSAPNIPVSVLDVDLAQQALLVRTDDGSQGWVDAHKFYSPRQSAKRDENTKAGVVAGIFAAVVAAVAAGSSREEHPSRGYVDDGPHRPTQERCNQIDKLNPDRPGAAIAAGC